MCKKSTVILHAPAFTETVTVLRVVDDLYYDSSNLTPQLKYAVIRKWVIKRLSTPRCTRWRTVSTDIILFTEDIYKKCMTGE